MLKNYFKIALRNIRRHFVYSFINIFGLAVGLASAIVIGLWVYQEWSYDRHFKHSDRIYRVGVNFMNIGDMAVGPPQLNKYVREFPEVEQTAILDGVSTEEFYIGDRQFTENLIYEADSTFFKIFSYPFLEGDPATALNQPDKIVLSESVARKFFPGSSALGKTVLMGEKKRPYTVSGVVKEEGYHSHMNARIWTPLEETSNTNWTSASVYNYVLLKRGVSEKAFEQRLRELIKTQVYPSLSPSTPFKEWVKKDGSYRFITMPVTDIYLKSDLKFEPTAGGNESNVNIFAAVALLIVVIAAINFINITTARSSIRAKEVGIRKTLGTGRGALIGQFLFESVLIGLFALGLGIGLAELFLSFFEKITGLELLESLFTSSTQVLAVTLIALLVGLLAGIYPAFHLTSFKPVKVLKGQIYCGNGKQNLLRNGLVILQFTISISLLIGIGVILKQLDHMQTRDMGLTTDDVLVISNTRHLGDQKDVLKEALLDQSGVEYASYNHRIPAGRSMLVSSFKTPEMEESIPIQSFWGDYDMIPTLGFRILKGRNFSRDIASDTSAVILNQSAVKILELKDPVGAKLHQGPRTMEVIGVVADFNFESLRKKIEPVALRYSPDGTRLAVKINSENTQAIIDRAKTVWDQIGAAEPMNYYFLDQNFEELIKKDRILFRAIIIFAVLAIIISCLGLYGLSAYITEQKTKEIGVRRVLGARVEDIVFMLNKTFTKPILLAILVSVLLSFIIMNKWLSNFAYKTEIGPLVFIAGSVAALIIAVLTVSGQSIKAALKNPVDSLRNE